MSEKSDAEVGTASGVHPAGPRTLLLARGIPAIAVGLVTTFTGGHSALFGLVAVAAWGIVGGVAEGVLVARMPLPPRPRTLQLARACAVFAVGVLAALLAASASSGALVYVVGAGATVIGGLDVGAGLLARGSTPLAREWILLGGITVLMGVLALVVPPGFRQPFPGAGGQPGMLTASTVVVGFFGAWGVVIGVLALIAAAGQRTGVTR